jgi:hypothetical protein
VNAPDTDRTDGAGYRPAVRLGRTPVTTRAPATDDRAEEQADIDRGRTDALLGALGRIQLRLEVLTREQLEHGAALQAMERRVAALELAQAQQPPPPPEHAQP